MRSERNERRRGHPATPRGAGAPAHPARALGRTLWILAMSVLIGGGFSQRARAQSTGGEAGVSTNTPVAVAVAELEALVQTLEDGEARARLVEQLRALIQARKAIAPEDQEEEQGIRARFLQAVSAQINGISKQITRAASLVTDYASMRTWLEAQVREPDRREYWIELAWQFAVVALSAVMVRWLAVFLLRGARKKVDAREAPTLAFRVTWLILRSVLDLVPIAAFAVAGYSILTLLQPHATTRLITLAFVNANIIAHTVVVLGKLILAPNAEQLRIVAIRSETANYLLIWLSRLTSVTVYGFFLLSALLSLGMAPSVFGLFEKLLGLMLATMVVILILQNRTAVSDWIAGRRQEEDLESGGESTPGATGAGVGAAADPGPKRIGESQIGVIRSRFADVWFALAILYVAGLFVVWALRIEGGFLFVCKASALTVAIFVLANILIRAVGRLLTRGFAISAEIKDQFPGIEAQANRYLPVLHLVSKVIIVLLAGLSVLQAWGVNSYDWVTSPLGFKILAGSIKIALMLTTALLVIGLFSAWVERYLNSKDSSGSAVQRSARVRTLLPLARKVVAVVLTLVVGLMILSEIGINIAPLLAGAGIVGLAIGFGAQTLVKDIITGAFILIEDLINVGDVVSVAGHSGLCEAISIRTIRLRDLSGTVHVIPFSEAGAIENLTKDFSYYVLNVGVAYREDTDEVVKVLREIAVGLESDPEFGPRILPPFEVLGVDSFNDSAVIVRCRIKTKPIQQWSVGREFNRRMKKRFDELNIEIPFPHRTIYFGVDKDGAAPAARLAVSNSSGGIGVPGAEPATAAGDAGPASGGARERVLSRDTDSDGGTGTGTS